MLDVTVVILCILFLILIVVGLYVAGMRRP